MQNAEHFPARKSLRAPIRRRLLTSALGLLHLLVLLSSTHAQSPVQPPFGLAWEKPALELEEALLGGSGRIVERKRLAGGGETWHVEGLPQPALLRAVFHLPKHKLAGVELQYGKDEWTPENYDALMQSVKAQLEAKHGPGTLIARKQETARGLLQTLLGYRWETATGSIELVYFAAQNPENLYRAVSLHYSAPVAGPPPVASGPGKEFIDPALPPLPEK